MTSYAGIIFDCDGTLIDSEDHHQAVFDTVSLKHNLLKRNPYQHIGLSLKDLWNEIRGPAHSSLSFEAWVQDIEACYRKSKLTIALRPNIKPLIQELYRLPLRLGCASNSPRKYILDNLGRNGILHQFDAIYAQEDGLYPKPHPEPYLKICKHLGLSPKTCIAVEDSPAGIKSAKEAGLTVIAFPHAYTQEADLSLADYVVKDIREVREIIGVSDAITKAA
jgi:HAD superfamily hydrolase (TIGR01509 family)